MKTLRWEKIANFRWMWHYGESVEVVKSGF